MDSNYLCVSAFICGSYGYCVVEGENELVARLKRHWSDSQIVELAAAVALNGFLNRWNDTMAPALEPEPIAFGEKHLKRHGWTVGKHKP